MVWCVALSRRAHNTDPTRTAFLKSQQRELSSFSFICFGRGVARGLTEKKVPAPYVNQLFVASPRFWANSRQGLCPPHPASKGIVMSTKHNGGESKCRLTEASLSQPWGWLQKEERGKQGRGSDEKTPDTQTKSSTPERDQQRLGGVSSRTRFQPFCLMQRQHPPSSSAPTAGVRSIARLRVLTYEFCVVGLRTTTQHTHESSVLHANGTLQESFIGSQRVV